MAANKNKYEVEFYGDVSGLRNSVREAQGILGQFGKNMETMFGAVGIGIAAAFSVKALSQFSQEAVKLAAEAEGIKQAFDRINGANIDKLKASVQGTVTEVQLMKAAVKANNFKIPIEQLGTFFEFATKRAAQTGESVDYLVESIILGIGRKSPLILDNLGISAVELRAKFKGISIEAATIADVAKGMGEIVAEQLERMGEVSLTTAQKMQQNEASLIDLQTTIGTKMVPIWLKWNVAIVKVLTSLEDIMMTAEEQGENAASNFFTSMIEDGLTGEALFDRYMLRLKALQNQINKVGWSAKQAGAVGTAAEQYRLLSAEMQMLVNEFNKYNIGLDAAAKKENDAVPVTEEAQKAIEAKAEALRKYERQVQDALLAIQELNDEFAAMSTGRTSALESRPNIDLDKLGLEDIERFSLDEPLDIDYTAFDALIEGQRMYNESLWLTQSLTTGIADAFAGAIVSGEDFGEAMKTILAETLKRLIAMVAQAVLLSAIMAALGGGSFAGVFKSVFGGLTGGGGSMDWNVSGLLQGDIIRLAGERSGQSSGRK